jgi:hypothetical protein
MLLKGFISPPSTKKASPLLFIIKKNYQIGFCVNFTSLNPETEKESYIFLDMTAFKFFQIRNLFFKNNLTLANKQQRVATDSKS